MRYNTENLYSFCAENNINLLNDYTNVDIKRESYIEGKCKTENCNDIFRKNMQREESQFGTIFQTHPH